MLRDPIPALQPRPINRSVDLVPSLLGLLNDLLVHPNPRAERDTGCEHVRMAHRVNQSSEAAHRKAGNPTILFLRSNPVFGFDLGNEFLDEEILVPG